MDLPKVEDDDNPGEIVVTVNEDKKDDKKVDKKKVDAVSVGELFGYADGLDKLLLFIGTVAALGNGLTMPIFSIFFGKLLDDFNLPPDELYHKVTLTCYWFLCIGAGSFLCGFLQTSLYSIAGERQARSFRQNFLKAIFRQEIGWFDKVGTGALTSRISGDTILVQDGLEKSSQLFQFGSQFVSGMVIAFIHGWKLTLVMMSVMPLLAISGFLMMKIIGSYSTRGQEAYAAAGNVATEVLSAIRTVASLSGEEKESARYKSSLTDAMHVGIRRGFLSGLGLGMTMFIMFGSYALALWYGSTRVLAHDMTGGEVMTVLFSALMGGFALGQTGPATEALTKARGAAFIILDTIKRNPLINIESDLGKKDLNVVGNIKFKNIKFRYPTRPEALIMDGLNLKIKSGQTTALVGPSGCGKSSIIQLTQRFYDPEGGKVYFDGEDIQGLNLKWFREQIGLVGQEPVLFTGTIAENICYGKPGASQAEIEEAAKASNAHNFIMEFPDKYNTQVGEKGAQLSGGQKQRIAIARAIIKNPKILLLDEATSALDNESEKIVQEALDFVMKGRTTIVIAHRLSTIRHADTIAVIHKGKVAELGNHEKLMEMKGIYYKLVKIQSEGMDEADVFDEVSDYKKETKKKKKEETEDKEEKITDQDKEAKLKKVVENYPVSYRRLFSINKPETGWFLLGILGTVVNGAAMPIFSIVFSNMVNLYYQPEEDIKRDTAMWSGIFIAIGAGPLIGNILTSGMMGVSSERFIRRIREMAFNSMVYQNISFFDLQEHRTGILTAHLAAEATLIGQLVGSSFGLIVQNIWTLITGLVIAFYYGWKLTLVVLAASPLMVFGQAMHMAAMKNFTAQTQSAFGEANQVATEAIANMRTVASFTSEKATMDKFEKKLEAPMKIGMKKSVSTGLSTSFGMFCVFGVYALCFWYGGKLIKDGEYDFLKVLTVIMAIAMSAMGIGQTAALSPDAAKAKAAASILFQIVDHESEVNASSKEGQCPEIKGDFELKNIDFFYPTRPDTKIFDGMSLKVKKGQVVALVGHSGSGKSTIIGLLERFYQPSSSDGVITIDDINIKDINIRHLRQNIGLVSQEPVLFSGSIGENIAYGKPGATQEDVEKAAKASNAHNFIMEFPDKYNTQVGEKGAQLSGGQKQRIAIARAIIKDPKILLLDEATSALDTESEKIVQEALDNVMKGRTTVIVAHRLSTIRHADIIAVIDSGKVVEQGKHKELMEKKGFYYLLASKQKKKKSEDKPE